MTISHFEILNLWPTTQLCAESTGLSLANIHAMRSRKKIPHAQFPKFVRAAENENIEGVTLQLLHDIADTDNITNKAS